MRHFPDTFTRAAPIDALVRQLIADHDSFRHLRRASIGCLFSQRVILDRGAPARVVIVVPGQISSKQIERLFHEWAMAQLFEHEELPDFVVFVDLALWQSDSELEREQLLFHELSHVQQKQDEFGAPRFEKSGRPALRLVPHDAEVFYSELKRYGRIVPAFTDTAIAIAEGARAHGPQLVKRRA